MVEKQDPDNFTRFQTRERCALEIAAYVFNLGLHCLLELRNRWVCSIFFISMMLMRKLHWILKKQACQKII